MSYELGRVMTRAIKICCLTLSFLFAVQLVHPMPSEDQSASGIPTQIVEPDNILPTSGEVISTTPASPLPEQKESNNSNKDIYLNFDNADLYNFVNYIAEIKKMNLVVDKTIEGAKISLTIRDPLTADGAWNVFLTVLEMAGFSIIQVGDIYKVIPKDQKTIQPLPAYINVSPDTLPYNDINIRYVLFLTNMDVTTMQELLQSMLSDKGLVIPVKDVNGFVITDKSLNIKAAVKLLLELDQMGTAEAVTVIKLKNANATDVKTLLEGLIKQPEVSPLARLLGKTAEGTTSYFPPGTRVIAEDRTNSLILLGNPKPIKKIEEFVVNHIDVELKQAKSPLHVYELQYTDATQIAEILKEATQAPETVAGQAASKYGAIRGGVKYFKSMNIKVDKDGNRLVVSSTDKVDWMLLKKTIKDLDKPQPQVALETMIVTIDVGDTKALGGGVRNKKHGMLGINIDAQSAAASTNGPSLELDSSNNAISLLGNMINQITPMQGLSTLTFGKPADIWGYLQALKTQTNTTVLSQPFMTVANKTAANVLVGKEQRVVQEQQSEGGLTGYEPVTANTDLTITPQINLDGLIRLDIDLKIDEFANAQATDKIKRNLKTNVAVADGQVLVLGGFVKTKVTETTQKTPVLGDIPIVGWLFKNQKRIITKEYLFIFLCPTIIKPRQIPGMNLYTKMKLHEATDEIEYGITTKKTPDPLHNWFFNPEKENYSHKVIDFANARYQPTTVDIKNDPYYRAQTAREEMREALEETGEKNSVNKVNLPKPELVEVPQLTAAREPMQVQQPEPVVVPVAPETEAREEFKNFISQVPAQVAIAPVPEKPVQKALPVAEDKRDALKKIISQPAKAENQDLNFDLSKRNRLKDFLSKNPMLSKDFGNEVKKMKEVSA
jgi:general secretion pathway protein D